MRSPLRQSPPASWPPHDPGDARAFQRPARTRREHWRICAPCAIDRRGASGERSRILRNAGLSEVSKVGLLFHPPLISGAARCRPGSEGVDRLSNQRYGHVPDSSEFDNSKNSDDCRGADDLEREHQNLNHSLLPLFPQIKVFGLRRPHVGVLETLDFIGRNEPFMCCFHAVSGGPAITARSLLITKDKILSNKNSCPKVFYVRA